MHRPIFNAGLLWLAASLSTAAAAGPGPQQAIRDSLQRVLPNVPVDSISASPVPGLSEVIVGPQVFYVSNDGKYLFKGSLIDLETRVDLSEERRKSIRLAALDGIGEDKMIIFPADKPRHTITVFTDIDCGYCRKLHSEIDKYNDEGITVRYLFFPRTGPDSPSFDKAVSVWCEADRNKALTEAKAGKELPKADCKNPVREEYELGELVGVRGTPAIILEDGEMLPGYIPPQRLAKALDSRS
jgi:thiol:disulfide interchange protein DsbC